MSAEANEHVTFTGASSGRLWPKTLFGKPQEKIVLEVYGSRTPAIKMMLMVFLARGTMTEISVEYLFKELPVLHAIGMHKDATSLRKANESSWPDPTRSPQFEILDVGCGLKAKVDTELPQPTGRYIDIKEFNTWCNTKGSASKDSTMVKGSFMRNCTKAVFQEFWTISKEYESRNRHVKTGSESKAHILSTIGGIPSRPLDLWMSREKVFLVRVNLGVTCHFTVNLFPFNSVATHVSLSPDTPQCSIYKYLCKVHTRRRVLISDNGL
ncbi:hypothetical protein EVAR_5961_1 [Eumeta japonica]|uniref:Uncharacterized protein n=1 Tax=Eumeta variegata TaxID=151549 RepID=A0A4C1TD59_EUMVA|nr:hypothetical protein EVAR_5961_1 [Eumeta japonica]